MPERDMELARSIARAVAEAGGRTFFVGGFVRDAMLGRSTKDVDIEVHGVTPEVLCRILDGLGRRISMGASFGVYGLKGFGLDIAMPRRERAVGRGHRDFEVDVDPYIGTRGAARRRDFTINAMMRDVLTGELVDPFGGEADLRRGVLRHVCDATFGEDPLRVLRAAQFAARFGFRIADGTAALARGMDLTALSRERVLGELCKALGEADAPSVFFAVLRDLGQLGFWFSELEALIGVEQNPVFHPEGDVWTHSLRVLDAAAKLRGEANYPLGLMLSAACHDLGKAATTRVVDGRIRAPGHDAAGVEIARRLLERLTNEAKLIRYVTDMVRLHMRPNQMAQQRSGRKAMAKLYDESVCPEDLLLLAKADRMGRSNGYDEIERFLRAELAAYRARMAEPQVTGADLLAAGMRPGAAVGEALRYAHDLHLSGVPREAALRQTLAFIRKRGDA